MERITKFTYSVGTSEELRTGDWDTLGIFDTPEGLERYLSNTGVILEPKFIGIYQQMNFDFQDYEEEQELEILRDGLRKREALMTRSANEVLKTHLGMGDSVHPDLIHVTYDPNLWTEDLVRKSLRDTTNRIAISSIAELPDFSEKNLDLIIKVMEQEIKLEEIGDPLKSDKDLIKDYLRELEILSKTYGLTRPEYAVLVNGKGKRSKILTHPILNSLTSLRPYFKTT